VHLKPFDANGAFRSVTPDGGDELRLLAVRSAGITVFSGGIGLALQVLATMILARLLTPRDFGLITMVTTFSLLLVNFGLNGFTEAVIQREEIDHVLASNLFWINLGAGLLLTIGFAAAGSLLARLYNDTHVAHIAVGISLTILVSSTSVLHLALLKRAMRFSVVSSNDIVARAISVLVSILCAWAGWGYWALVAGAITLPMSTSIGAWVLCRWVPGRPRSHVGTGSMVRFAINTYGRFGVNYLTRNTDNLLIGWRFNAQSLGFYKRAYDLFALSAGQLVASITVVAVSALSRVNRDTVQYRRYLLGALTVMAFLGMGLAADLTLVGKDLIRVLLGPGWEESGRIFTFFGPGIGVMILYYTHGWIHLSIGRADRWFRWGCVEVVVTCLLFLAGLPWGPVGIAVAWTASFWLLTIPALWYAGRPIGFEITPVLAVVWRYLLAALLAGVATAAITRMFPSLGMVPGATGALVRVIVISLSLGVLYLGGVVLLHGGFEPLYQIMRLLREMVPWGKLAGLSPVVAGSGLTCEFLGDYGAREVRVGSKEQPLVSILIPAHNAEEWIADTLRSAIAQTWERKEIIIVDDGSTDKTVERARQFESEWVHVVKQQNQGASAARNRAFSLSQGDYIQWLDADDLLAPDKISRQLEALNEWGGNKRTLLSSPWGKFMYRPYRARFIPTALWRDLSPVEWLLHKMGDNVFMQTATWLVSRELTEAAGPWDTRLLGDDDGEYFCRVLLASDGVRFVPDARVYYRTFGFDSLGYIDRSPRKLKAHWLSMQLHIGYLRSLEESSRVHAACMEYLRTSLIHFYPERRDIVQQAEQMANELGQQLGVPTLSWKYSWIEKTFGWGLAKPVQRSMRRFRWSIEKRLDKVLFLVDNWKLGSVARYQTGNRSFVDPGAEVL
jgi:O-antigen/teichoic acid export membrane protein/glycosyltransferase involved in cell wall biosynthesis